jgi:hypothetical protein
LAVASSMPDDKVLIQSRDSFPLSVPSLLLRRSGARSAFFQAVVFTPFSFEPHEKAIANALDEC